MKSTDKINDDFLKSLGLPSVTVHPTLKHFDFTQKAKRILIIGPMGSGKTEYASRIYKDALVAQQKGTAIREMCVSQKADRRNIFFIRSEIDKERFKEYPQDALAYRGGYVRCGKNIAAIKNSFDLEQVISDNPTVGTFIIDEASFFDERIAYVVQNHSLKRDLIFIFPTLILNFRRELFNSTARLMLEVATDVIPLTAYCEHPDCLQEAFYTYRYYLVDNQEAPALYFDPLIVVGGDKISEDENRPNYCARCEKHHYLPAKEYSFFTLKPLGEDASKGNVTPLKNELKALKENMRDSLLYSHIVETYKESEDLEIYLNSLKISLLAEKALIFLFGELNQITEELLVQLAYSLQLDRSYMEKVLNDNLRAVTFSQPVLLY